MHGCWHGATWRCMHVDPNTAMRSSADSMTRARNPCRHDPPQHMRQSKTYLVNGVVLVLDWLVFRILLFVPFFWHFYTHRHEFVLVRHPCVTGHRVWGAEGGGRALLLRAAAAERVPRRAMDVFQSAACPLDCLRPPRRARAWAARPASLLVTMSPPFSANSCPHRRGCC